MRGLAAPASCSTAGEQLPGRLGDEACARTRHDPIRATSSHLSRLFAQLSLAARAGPWAMLQADDPLCSSWCQRRSPAVTPHARHQQHCDGRQRRRSTAAARATAVPAGRRRWVAAGSGQHTVYARGHAYSVHSGPAGEVAVLDRGSGTADAPGDALVPPAASSKR